MDITITTKKFHLSDELRARIDKKLPFHGPNASSANP